jgi:hypothetical protein
MCFVNRVRRFSGNLYIAVFCWVLTAVRLGIGAWATVVTGEDPNIITFDQKYRWSMMFFVLGTTIDFTVAISLCYFLANLRRTSIKRWVLPWILLAPKGPNIYFRTVRLIDSLIAWAIGEWWFLSWCVYKPDHFIMFRNRCDDRVTFFDLSDAGRLSDVASMRLTSVSLIICVSFSSFLIGDCD